MTKTEQITAADIKIDTGLWHDGAKYRAAYVTGTDNALTGPEHAGLSDDALMAEALREAKRAGILAR